MKLHKPSSHRDLSEHEEDNMKLIPKEPNNVSNINWRMIYHRSINFIKLFYVFLHSRLKKLHQAQLLLGPLSVFNQPNLERDLSSRQNDNFIGTHNFWPNQYDLYYIWHQMEQSSQFQQNVVAGIGSESRSEGIMESNFQYYSEKSGIDFKSSAQVVFDVLSQLVQVSIGVFCFCFVFIVSQVKKTVK